MTGGWFVIVLTTLIVVNPIIESCLRVIFSHANRFLASLGTMYTRNNLHESTQTAWSEHNILPGNFTYSY